MNRMKWTWLISVFLLAGLIIAANVKVQYTGPQGQGDVQWAKTSDGTVQLQLGTTALLNVGNITGSGTVQGEQLTSTDDALVTDDLTVSGLVSVAESVTAEQLTSTDDATIAGAVTIGETLAVTGVVTLTAAPVVTAVTASGAATAVMTNAPAITEETPIWITITYGGNDYVIPAWDLD